MREAPLDRKRASIAVDVTAVEGLAPEIDAVAARADPRHAFLRRAWYEGVAAAGPRTLVARRPDGNPDIAIPTCAVGPAALGLRAVPGCYWPFRSFPLSEDLGEDELAVILATSAAKRSLGSVWRLGPIMSDDPTIGRLLPALRRAGWTPLARFAGIAYSLDIGEELESGPWPRPSTQRNNHKHEKRLARLGEVTCRLIRGAGWTAEAIDKLAEVERNSWVGRRRDADPKFLDPALRRLWERAARDPEIAERLSAALLLVGGVPASFSFGIDAGGVRYSIASSYDERFARHSPGSLVGYRAYAESVARGVSVLNLGSGDTGQKVSMGAVPGPSLHDYLFVRSPLLAAFLRPLWVR